MFLSVLDITKSTILTAGAYGPDGSLFAALIGSIAIFAILYARSKGWTRLGLRFATIEEPTSPLNGLANGVTPELVELSSLGYNTPFCRSSAFLEVSALTGWNPAGTGCGGQGKYLA